MPKELAGNGPLVGKEHQVVFIFIKVFKIINDFVLLSRFFECIGLLHINDPNNKMNERTPDRGGKVTIDKKIYKLGCWNKETTEGAPYTSIGFRKFEEKKEEVTNLIDDKNIPF